MEKFIRFLNASPTAYHAVKEITTLLAEQDFFPLYEGEKWKLEPGKGYFLTREDSLCIAFRMPKKKPERAMLLASHTDSPALKIKPRPELNSHGIGELLTESYGAPILHTWFDRDLCIAGRIVTADKNGKAQIQFVQLDDYPVVIPSVAIHLNREINEKGPQINKQDHLRAIFSLSPKEKHLEDLLKKHHSFHQLLGFDLLLTPLEKARMIGFEDELISSYRIDNLSSVYASLEALLSARPSQDCIQMAIFWDHEEIGSKTYTGAESLLVNQVLERISSDRESYYQMKSRSFCISCDVSHAYHPNFGEKYDLQNAPVIGKGPAVKFSPRYATTGPTAAQMALFAKKRKVPLQTFCSRSDISSGGTVGAIMGSNLGIPTVDIGIGCWGMHSIRETIAAGDQKALSALLKASLEEGYEPL